MLAIGARTSAQSEESKRTREAKVRLIVNAEKTTKMLKEKVRIHVLQIVPLIIVSAGIPERTGGDLQNETGGEEI